MDALVQELKVKIIEALNLSSVSPQDIVDDAQLVGGDLGLDSIDVLEMVMMIEREYGVKIDNREVGIQVFASVKSLADYIYHNRSENNG
ncbi:MAG: phosphopantetheine-binding protein [Pseudomonadota bacterium]